MLEGLPRYLRVVGEWQGSSPSYLKAFQDSYSGFRIRFQIELDVEERLPQLNLAYMFLGVGIGVWDVGLI